MTHPSQKVEGEVKLVLTIQKVVQTYPPEVLPSLVTPVIGLPSLIALAIGIPALIPRVSPEVQVYTYSKLTVPVTSPEVHPSLITSVKGPEVHSNLIAPVKGPEVHPSFVSL